MNEEVSRFKNISKICQADPSKFPSLCTPPDNRRKNTVMKHDKSLYENALIDRDYVVKTMVENRGYCPNGIQSNFREHVQAGFSKKIRPLENSVHF